MNDLAMWLTQILDEDEKAAKRAGGSITEMQNDNYGQLLVPSAWVLADIAAKRAIIAWCTERDRVWVGNFGGDPTDPQNYAPGDLTHRTDSPVLRLLASAYADRLGYREAWAPSSDDAEPQEKIRAYPNLVEHDGIWYVEASWQVERQPFSEYVGQVAEHDVGWTAHTRTGAYVGLYPDQRAAAKALVEKAGYELGGQ